MPSRWPVKVYQGQKVLGYSRHVVGVVATRSIARGAEVVGLPESYFRREWREIQATDDPEGYALAISHPEIFFYKGPW